MAAIEWNQQGQRFFETGLDRGVLYPRQTHGVPWLGLVSVSESVSGGESESYYFDGVKYLDFIAAEDFSATIEAYSTPPEFAGCDGTKILSPGLMVTQQPRYPFGFSFRTLIGNDTLGTDYGYKLHLVYNATASPSSMTHQTISENVSPNTRQWKIDTVPPLTTIYKPTAHFVIDSTLVDPDKLTTLEDHIYGNYQQDPELPTQSEVIAMLS